MSQFEYISVAVSLVLTFGAARLLGGVPYLLLGGRRYWVHTLWCAQAILNLATFWWVFWNFRLVDTWTLGSFLLVLSYPAFCYVGAAVLVPGEASRDTDWRAHFFRMRRAMFSVFGLSVVTMFGLWILVFGAPLLAPPLYLSALFLSLYVVGFVSSSPAVQGTLVVINLIGVVAIYGPVVNHPFLE